MRALERLNCDRNLICDSSVIKEMKVIHIFITYILSIKAIIHILHIIFDRLFNGGKVS